MLRNRLDLAGALAAGQQALVLATTHGDLALQAAVSHSLGQVYLVIGDYRRAAELFRRSVEAIETGTGRPNPPYRITSQVWLANALSYLGQFAEGRHHGEEALRLATVEGRGNTPMVAHSCLGRLYLNQGDLAAAIRVLDQGLALCRAADAWDSGRVIAAGLGYALALAGRLAEGRALLEEAIRESRRLGAHAQSLYIARLSAVCLLAGCVDEAMQHAGQALALARQSGARGHEAFALCQLGAVQAQADPPDAAPAEAYYQQALALAEVLGMRPLQAHCHLGLGTLYAKIGQAKQACGQLSTAITLYRAMDTTFWLPQAEGALAQALGAGGQ